MNSSVALMIALFDLRGNLSSPYKIIETKSSLERFDKPHESKVACTWLRRLFLCRCYEWQCSKKCSVSSTPSFIGHIGFNVSLKLCLNLWKLSALNPTRSCVRVASPLGSWIPNTCFGVGRIILFNFALKTPNEGAFRVSGSIFSHSARQWG